jgi:hypothetical protein
MASNEIQDLEASNGLINGEWHGVQGVNNVGRSFANEQQAQQLRQVLTLSS